MKIVYFASKNKYGYTKRQLKIDYDKKTYKVGNFVIRADKNIRI